MSTKQSQAEREQRFCEREGKETEWRRYRIDRKWLPEDTDKATGEYRYQWRCYSCLRMKDNAAKARKRREERARRNNELKSNQAA